MSRAMHPFIPPVRTILGLLGAIALFGLPGQAQTGRILVDNTGPSILEFNTDGSNGFAIAGNTDNNVVFSPSVAGNGTIAFTANTDVDGTYLVHPYIFLMNADGTNVHNISSSLPGSSSNCCYNLNPAISPDGSKVAFLASINVAPDGSFPQEIYLVNADGSNLRQLTPFVAIPNNSIGDYSQGYVTGFAWSPDSSTLAFRGTAYTAQCGADQGQSIIVNVIESITTGGTVQFLACDNNDGYVSSIDWSPDGSLIAWTRNVGHGAQGGSGQVGEPAIAFLALSGQTPAGLTSGQLTTDSCQGGPHCIHFSPDGSQLAYVDSYPNNGNPCQSSCTISFINLNGSGQTNSTIPSGGHTVWWMPGSAIPAPAQLTVSGPGGPGSAVEVWPGFSQQVTPSLSDSGGNLILHTAQNYFATNNAPTFGCLTMGPYGLALFTNRDGQNAYGTISATNAQWASPTISYKCWQSSPCTFTLGSTYTNIPSNGGPGMVGVTVDAGSSGSTCPWSAIPSASWIMITSGASGSGNGSVNFTVAGNSGAARQATISIAGQTYTVNQDAAGSGVTLSSITVTPNPASVSAGLTQQFTATGHYSDSSTKDLTTSVTWSSSDTNTATISNAAGSQGLAMGVKAGGPITIQATFNTVNGTANLTVTSPLLQSISVLPSGASIPVGATQQFTATGHYSDSSTQDLTSSATWVSSNSLVATISNAAGTQGLAKGVATGTATITASLSSITSNAASFTVTPVAPVSISVMPVNAQIPVGASQQYTATLNYSDGTTKNITKQATWSSSNTAIATFGKGGAAKAVGLGSTTIGASFGGLTGSTILTTFHLTVSPASATIVVGGTQQFAAMANYASGPPVDVTKSVTWNSSNNKVATVSATGLAHGMKAGKANITATALGVSSAPAILTVQ